MAIGSTPGGSGHVVPDDPDHRLVTPEDTVAMARMEAVSYTHLTLPTIHVECRSRWSPYH